MAKRVGSGLILVAVAVTLVFSFQNCGSAFEAAKLDSVSLVELGSGEIPLTITDSKGQPVSEATELIVDEPYKVVIAGVRIPAGSTVTWTASVTPGGGVHVHNGAVITEAELHCEASGIINLSGTIVAPSGTFNVVPMTFSCSEAADGTPPPAVDPTAQVVTFRIPAGTGRTAWNNVASTVRVFVGQTLRIVNDDSVNHRLHTGGAPCGHQPSNSVPGASFDCVVIRPLEASAGRTYDHLYGTGARFFVTSIDGPALYTTNCQSCHGVRATSEVRGMTATEIRAAILSEPQMTNLNLTNDQLEAIAYSLTR